MTRCAVFVACVGVFCLGIPLTASAEPVTITGGSLVFSSGSNFQGGPISLTGTRGFSVQGGVDSGETTIPGLGCCFPPGSTLSPGRAHISGNAWGADVTLDGQTFRNVGNGNSLTSLSLDLFVTMIVPDLQSSPVTVRAPFTATGELFRADPDLPPLDVTVQGSGTVSVIFSEVPGGVWASGGVRYDFGSTPTPTPEPATLTLISGGLVAAASRARKRRNRKTGIQLSTSTPTA